MSKSIKLKNDTYLDSSGVIHNRNPLNDLIPIGINGIICTSINENPSLAYGGTWEKIRTLYGGELLAFGVISSTSDGRLISSFSNTEFSSSYIGSKSHQTTNFVNGIMEFRSGAYYISTQGIVGLVEASITISGYGNTSGLSGIWWGGNYNTLPSGVTELSKSSNRYPLLSGPIGLNYGGNSNTYYYKVDSTSNLEFFVNPSFLPYNGDFTPGQGGVGCNLKVKVYAKYGITYLWKRTA